MATSALGTRDASKLQGLEIEDLQELLPAAEGGDANAQYAVGTAFRYGDDGVANPRWAAHWLNKAAEQGDPRAQLEVGMLFLGGVGVKEDVKAAAAWVSAAANQGLAAAQYQMGMMLMGGIGVDSNLEWAVYWLEKAAEQDCAHADDAQYRLGLLFESGQGSVEPDWRKAMFWFERAAEKGHAQAFDSWQVVRRRGCAPPAKGNTPGLPAKIRRELYR